MADILLLDDNITYSRGVKCNVGPITNIHRPSSMASKNRKLMLEIRLCIVKLDKNYYH